MESVCLDLFDGPEVGTKTMRKARKLHKCCECHQEINPGETYEHVTGLWDGAWSSFKTCAICVRIRDDLFPCGYEYEGLAENLDCYFDINADIYP